MKNITIFLFLTMLVIGSDVLAQQDPLTRLFFSQQTWYNPAYTGSAENNNLMISGQQVQGADSDVETVFLTYDHHFDQLNSGIGLVLMQDELGLERRREAGIMYSYHWQVSDSLRIRFGMQLSLIQTKVTGRFIARDDPAIDPSIPSGEMDAINWNVGIGFEWRGFDIGYSIKHFNEPVLEDSKLGEYSYDMHHYVIAKYDWYLSSLVTAQPSILYAMSGSSSITNPNWTMLWKNRIYTGIGQYIQDGGGNSSVFNLGYQFPKAFRIDVGYQPDNNYNSFDYGPFWDVAMNVNF